MSDDRVPPKETCSSRIRCPATAVQGLLDAGKQQDAAAVQAELGDRGGAASPGADLAPPPTPKLLVAEAAPQQQAEKPWEKETETSGKEKNPDKKDKNGRKEVKSEAASLPPHTRRTAGHRCSNKRHV